MPSTPSTAEPRGTIAPPRHYRGLDLIRGLAAIAVLVYHTDFMFGARDRLMPGSYLSVDLFFILSGFVIACNYEAPVRLGQISFARFLVRRFARLYPLYLVTFAVGLVVMTARYRSMDGYIDTGRLFQAALANLALLPSFAMPYGQPTLFLFNAASWSIFYELFINVVFVVLLARLKLATLVAAWVVAAAALVASVLTVGNVDVGWATQNFVPAFPRVTFSFITGMLIWRGRARGSWTTPAWVLPGLLATCGLLFQARLWIPPALHGAVDLVAVAALLPAIVVAGVGVRFGPRGSATAALLGDISYSVYLTQGSLIIAAAGFTQAVLGRKIYDLGPAAGLVCVPLFIGLSYVSFKTIEAPARTLIRSLSTRRTSTRTRDPQISNPISSDATASPSHRLVP